MENPAIQTLKDKRVFIDYGPVSMVITAKGSKGMMTDVAADSFSVVEEALNEISKALPQLKRYPGELQAGEFPGLPGKMIEAVKSVGEPTLTPMAAVAGAIADMVADWIASQGAVKVIVNNGGDIALRLKGKEEARVGILSSPDEKKMNKVITIHEEDGIGGICTSGLGGRSFTRGIANEVSVFSKRCITADACATHIANVSYVKSPHVSVMKAGDIDAASDIADLTIVTAVEALDEKEIKRGLAQMKNEMQRQCKRGNLIRGAADIQGHKLYYSFT